MKRTHDQIESAPEGSSSQSTQPLPSSIGPAPDHRPPSPIPSLPSAFPPTDALSPPRRDSPMKKYRGMFDDDALADAEADELLGVMSTLFPSSSQVHLAALD